MTTSSPLLRAFDPIADKHAHTLILGSMPGEASLQAGQYYAHSRNLFWPIVAEVMGFSADLRAELHELRKQKSSSKKMPEALYAKCCAALQASGCALWDVLATCERTGSLDAAIRNGQPNDFPAFFAQHPRITRVFFNGGTAEGEFRRKVLPKLELSEGRPLTLCRLPSTSPAYAAMNRADKIDCWCKAWKGKGETPVC